MVILGSSNTAHFSSDKFKMSEFDAFGEVTDEQPPVVEEDPAADFLAREQDELKGLEDDNFGETTDVQINQEQQQGDDFDPFTSGQSGGSPQPDGDFFGGEPIQDATGEEDGEPVTNGPIDGYSAIGQVDRQRAEPEQIRIWREENARRIEKKDAEEAKRKEEWRNIAKKELEDWYKHHDEQLSKTKENNRNRTNNQPASEAAFIEDRDQTQPGEEWEKICRLCEFNPKNSKNTKDISRMRQILLQLKQTPLIR